MRLFPRRRAVLQKRFPSPGLRDSVSETRVRRRVNVPACCPTRCLCTDSLHLLNFCADETILLSFTLSGPMALEGVIRGISEFVQRLPVRFYLGNLNLRDTRDRVRHQLEQAAVPDGREIFSPTHTKLLSWFRRA